MLFVDASRHERESSLPAGVWAEIGSSEEWCNFSWCVCVCARLCVCLRVFSQLRFFFWSFISWLSQTALATPHFQLNKSIIKSIVLIMVVWFRSASTWLCLGFSFSISPHHNMNSVLLSSVDCHLNMILVCEWVSGSSTFSPFTYVSLPSFGSGLCQRAALIWQLPSVQWPGQSSYREWTGARRPWQVDALAWLHCVSGSDTASWGKGIFSVPRSTDGNNDKKYESGDLHSGDTHVWTLSIRMISASCQHLKCSPGCAWEITREPSPLCRSTDHVVFF